MVLLHHIRLYRGLVEAVVYLFVPLGIWDINVLRPRDHQCLKLLRAESGPKAKPSEVPVSVHYHPSIPNKVLACGTYANNGPAAYAGFVLSQDHARILGIDAPYRGGIFDSDFAIVYGDIAGPICPAPDDNGLVSREPHGQGEPPSGVGLAQFAG